MIIPNAKHDLNPMDRPDVYSRLDCLTHKNPAAYLLCQIKFLKQSQLSLSL